MKCEVYRNEEYSGLIDTDLIFVHGIASSIDHAWRNEFNELWPCWLLQIFPSCRILLVQYPSTRFFCGESEMVSISERSINILDYLHLKQVGKRSIIFICHSLGGLLVKELLRVSCSVNKYSSFYEKTLGVIFLATPHKGAKIATLAKLFGISSELTSDLASDSRYLIDLADWFCCAVRKKKIFVSSYYEKKRYKRILVVDKESADPGCATDILIGLDYNHITITKPQSSMCDLFERILSNIRNIIMRQVNGLFGNDNYDYSEKIMTLSAMPELTIIGFLDVCHCLQVLLAKNGLVADVKILQHLESKRCTIVTQNNQAIEKLKPIQEKWPNHFYIRKMLLGEFVTDSKRSLKKYESKHEDVNRVQLIRLLAELMVKAADMIVDYNVGISWKSEVGINFLSTAHDFNAKVDSVLEDYVDNLLKKKTALTGLYKTYNDMSKPLVKESVDKAQKKKNMDYEHAFVDNMITCLDELYGRGLGTRQKGDERGKSNTINTLRSLYVNNSIFRRDLFGEVKNVYLFRNDINIRINDFGDKKSNKYNLNAKIWYADYSADIVIVVVGYDHKTLPKWMASNKDLLFEKGKIKTGSIKKGMTCYSWVGGDKKWTVDSVDESCIFPYKDSLIELSSLIALSGSDVKYGDSGMAVIDNEGKIIGIVVGKTASEENNKILVMPLRRHKEIFKHQKGHGLKMSSHAGDNRAQD